MVKNAVFIEFFTYICLKNANCALYLWIILTKSSIYNMNTFLNLCKH